MKRPKDCQVADATSAPEETVNSGVPPKTTAASSVNTYAVVNENSQTMHSVITRACVYTGCSWSFQDKTKVMDTEHFRGGRAIGLAASALVSVSFSLDSFTVMKGMGILIVALHNLFSAVHVASCTDVAV